MSKVGVKKIQIAKKGKVDDSFFDRTSISIPLNGIKNFTEIPFVQDTAVLSDETVLDDNGVHYTINLDFSLRKDYERYNDILEKFIDTPVILLVEAVDGCSYLIGNNQSPAYLSRRSWYNALSVKEHQISLEYHSIDGLYDTRLSDSGSVPDTPSIVVSNKTIVVPQIGGFGVVSVEAEGDWSVEVVNS